MERRIGWVEGGGSGRKGEECLRELTVRGEDERVSGTDGGTDEETRGASEDGFDEGRRVGVSVKLKAEIAWGYVMTKATAKEGDVARVARFLKSKRDSCIEGSRH